MQREFRRRCRAQSSASAPFANTSVGVQRLQQQVRRRGSCLSGIDTVPSPPPHSIVARLMREGAGAASDLRQPHLHTMPDLAHWTALRAAQNEAWCGALLADGDKVVALQHANSLY